VEHDIGLYRFDELRYDFHYVLFFKIPRYLDVE